MESSDVFAQEISPEDDPFAGTDFGDFGDPAAQPTSELPVVDREGNPVPGPATNAETGEVTQPGEPLPEAQATGLPTLTPEQQSAEAEQYRQAHGEPQEAAPDAPDPTPVSSPAPEAPAAEATEAPVVADTEAPPPSAASETAPPEVTQPEADAAADGATPQPVPNTPPLAEEVVETDDAEAPVPEEPKDKRGRVTHRRYIVLRVEGPGKFSQIHWYEDGKGKMVSKGPGAKRQTVALARSAEEALKIGYAAVGAPADGVTLVAVAAAYFQAKKVAPLPPEPSKQRLQIS